MTNFKNTIVNATLSSPDVNENGKTFIKMNIFKNWVQHNLTKEFLPSGKKHTVKLYEGGRGYDDALQSLASGKTMFSLVGCLVSFNLRKDEEVIVYNRLILQEDECDLADIYQEELSYWREEGSLIEDTQIVSQVDVAEEATKTVKAKA
jgi:antitoxin component YwqK of YwqJK toxin-antitoxin module